MSSEQQPMQTVKVNHCGQTKRTEFARANLTYENLCAWLTTAFGVTVDGVTPPIPRIVYRDPEGDIVSVSSTAELLDAVRLVASNGVLVLQLTFPRPRDRWYRHAANGSFGNLDVHATDNDVEAPVEANEAQEPKSEGASETSDVDPSAAAPARSIAGKPAKEEIVARRQALVAWRTAVAEARQNGTDLPPHPFLGMDHPVHHRYAAAQAKRTARFAARAARAQDENGSSFVPPSAIPAAVAGATKTQYAPNSQPMLAYPMWAPCTTNSDETGAGVPVNGVSSDRMLLFVPSLGKVFAPVSLAGTPNETSMDNVVVSPASLASPSTSGDASTHHGHHQHAEANWRGRRPFFDRDERRRMRQQNQSFSVSIEPAADDASAANDAMEQRRQCRMAKKTARLARFG